MPRPATKTATARKATKAIKPDKVIAPSRRTTPKKPKAITPAVQAEANGAETISIDWDGVTVVFPASLDDWDPDTLEAFEGGKAITAIRGLLGSASYENIRDQWARKNGHRPKIGDMTGLFEALATAYGFESQ